MEKIARKLTDLVGNTPLLELSNYSKSNGLKARLIVKIESFNPAGSVKDRVALAMIEDAEVKGVLISRRNNHRAYQWKYGSRIGIRCCRQGVQTDFDDARYDER